MSKKVHFSMKWLFSQVNVAKERKQRRRSSCFQQYYQIGSQIIRLICLSDAFIWRNVMWQLHLLLVCVHVCVRVRKWEHLAFRNHSVIMSCWIRHLQTLMDYLKPLRGARLGSASERQSKLAQLCHESCCQLAPLHQVRVPEFAAQLLKLRGTCFCKCTREHTC